MGVYIKGMEMPTSCDDCEFCKHAISGYDWCSIPMVNGRSKPLDEPVIKPDWCPLIELPPHGRLIDADELHQSIKDSIDECHKWAEDVESGEMYARVSQALGTFVECALRVKNAPTVIPAEEVPGHD